MQYCEKCHFAAEDSAAKCPNCQNQKLRAIGPDDMVLLQRADQYTAKRLTEQFETAGIPFEEEPFGQGRVSYLYDSEVMPTDKNLYVRFADLETARAASAGVKAAMKQEQESPEEEFEDMPRKKRILVQTVSVIAFLVLVMLTVFGADALANWLKSIFGI